MLFQPYWRDVGDVRDVRDLRDVSDVRDERDVRDKFLTYLLDHIFPKKCQITFKFRNNISSILYCIWTEN